jgi:hypothetical protein
MAKPGRKPKLTVVGGGGTGNLTHDNTKNALNEDEVHALTLRHKGKYVAALAAKKKASAEFLNCTKLIKAELGDDGLADIKDMIAAETDENYEAKLQAELDRKMRLARWQGLSVGTQANMFGDTAPSQRERGHTEGKRDGMSGKECKTDFAPGTEGYDGYMEGWHAGAAIKSNMDREQEEGAAILLRPEGNEPEGPDAFDAAADDLADIPLAPEAEPWDDVPVAEPVEDDVVEAPAVEAEPWPDDARLGEREPAEVL